MLFQMGKLRPGAVKCVVLSHRVSEIWSWDLSPDSYALIDCEGKRQKMPRTTTADTAAKGRALTSGPSDSHFCALASAQQQAVYIWCPGDPGHCDQSQGVVGAVLGIEGDVWYYFRTESRDAQG
jgi:hypothetical protein